MWLLCQNIRSTQQHRVVHISFLCILIFWHNRSCCPEFIQVIVVRKLWWNVREFMRVWLLNLSRFYSRVPANINLYRSAICHVSCNFELFVRPIYRTGTPILSKNPILCIFSTNIRTAFFKRIAHSFFPLQNAVYFIMLPLLVLVLFAFYIKVVLKFKCQTPRSAINLTSTRHVFLV
jgi:hypothetical protein